MAHGVIYIEIVKPVDGINLSYKETLEENGNAQDFSNHLQTGEGSVTELIGNTDDYSPTSWATKKNFVISAATPLNITGWVSGEPWEEKRIIIAEGSSTITFTNNDDSSNDANQMYCHGNTNIVASSKDIFIMVYDPTATKWRIK